MRIIGLDPGAKFTGVAVLDTESMEFVFWAESDDPIAIWQMAEDHYRKGDRIVLEDILGGGRRDEFIQRTIEVLGYLDYRCTEAGMPVRRVPNQARLANVRNVPAKIRGKDERAAAAHALSDHERNPPF